MYHLFLSMIQKQKLFVILEIEYIYHSILFNHQHYYYLIFLLMYLYQR